MPHDATPRNGRMYGSGFPGWLVALALALVFSAAAAIVAIATGLFFILLPALAVVALGYGLYAAVASSRRRRYARDWERGGVVQDARARRRRRLRRDWR